MNTMSKNLSTSPYQGHTCMTHKKPMTRVAKFYPTHGNTPNKNGGHQCQHHSHQTNELRGVSEEHYKPFNQRRLSGDSYNNEFYNNGSFYKMNNKYNQYNNFY